MCIWVPGCSKWSSCSCSTGHCGPCVHGFSNHSDSCCVSTSKHQAGLTSMQGEWPGSHVCVSLWARHPSEMTTGRTRRSRMTNGETMGAGVYQQTQRRERVCVCVYACTHTFTRPHTQVYLNIFMYQNMYMYRHTHCHHQTFILLSHRGDKMLQQLQLYWVTRFGDP